MRKIRKCDESDLITICKVINDGATAYQGKIPEVFTNQLYMDLKHLKSDIKAGVTFWALEDDDAIKGVMGLQSILDVTLIRHAYVRTESQGEGIGSALLTFLLALISGRILVGTWAAAHWAIAFYRRHGFILTPQAEKDALLEKYWVVSESQKESSVVLVQYQ